LNISPGQLPRVGIPGIEPQIGASLTVSSCGV
jgi:hypothetical protein